MNGFIRHAAVAGALALGLSVGATDGLAQSNSNATSKDLSVEAVPPPHWQAPPQRGGRRDRRTGRRRRRTGGRLRFRSRGRFRFRS